MYKKIREEIERRIKELKSHFPKGLDYHSYRVEELESFLAFIHTLEKSEKMKQIEKLKLLWEDGQCIDGDVSNADMVDKINEIIDVLNSRLEKHVDFEGLGEAESISTEKKYKEALEKVRKAYQDIKPENTALKTMLEEAFPQLRYNENERLKKQCIQLLKESYSTDYRALECIGWLENLKEDEAVTDNDVYENVRAICSYLDSYARYHERDGYGVEECMLRKNWLKKHASLMCDKAELTSADTATIKELVSFLRDGKAVLQHDCNVYADWLENRFKKLLTNH